MQLFTSPILVLPGPGDQFSHTVLCLCRESTSPTFKIKINQMSMSEVLDLVKLKRAADQANIGEASSRFSKDKPPKPRKFKEETDDSVRHLHKARFLRAPLSDLKKWWRMMPAARSHIYKTIPLKFSGSQRKISEKTIGFLHDRAKALTIKNFHSQNVCVAAKPMKKIEIGSQKALLMGRCQCPKFLRLQSLAAS